MPALTLDAAFVHLNRADERGNAQFLGPDLYFDDLFLGAAATGRRFLSCEKVVPTAELLENGTFHTIKINRSMVDGVIEAPNGAHFTNCQPDYERDEAFQKEYAKAAGRPRDLAGVRRHLPVRQRSRLPEGGGLPMSTPTSLSARSAWRRWPTRSAATARSSPRAWATSRRSAPAWPGPPSSPTSWSPTARPSSSPTTCPSVAPTRRSRAGSRSAPSSTSSGAVAATW